IKDKCFTCHLKINTGMNRLGINSKEELNEVYKIIKNANITIEGIYTHIYKSSDKVLTEKQFKRFENITKDIDLNEFEIVHIPNSETITNYKKKDYVNGCRMGIIMYGFSNNLNLESVFTLKSRIIEIKHIKKDDTVGYDGNYKATKDELIGIIPIGYADGIIRKNTGRYVYINNKQYQIVGNICMDMLFVLIDENVKLNDEVLIIKDNNHINEIANHLDTINYEVMCSISNRVNRKYTNK
ncbi:alanine racemase, partial [Holdemanella sp. SCCA2]|nr:alanine racemase [Holdemanella sp. SCCA2]